MPQPRTHTSHAQRQAAYRKRQEQRRVEELHAKGLPPLPAIPTIPGHARWSKAISQAGRLLGMVVAEMQDYFDERTEDWQESDRGVSHQERIEALEEIVDALEDA